MPLTSYVAPCTGAPEGRMAGGARVSTQPLGELDARLAAARPRLARLARLNGASASEAEDIAQETLLTAWRSLGQLREPERFDAWLDGICRNVSRHAARRALRERGHVLDSGASAGDEGFDPLAQAPADDADPLDELTRRELATLVESALSLLNDAAREAVQVRYLADLPSDEAAARLGLSVNALEARLSRARKSLRAALNGPLRERAVEFGLALADADAAGWRETSIWCHFCGRSRMQGILADAPNGGSLSLRCPFCWRDYGIVETNILSAPDLAGLTSFRPALKRVLDHGVVWSPESQRLETRCFTCGRPLAARMGRFSDFPEMGGKAPLFAHHYSALYDCPQCGSSGSGAAAIAGRSHPVVRRFLLERPGWVIEPDEWVEYQGSPSIRFTLRDRANGDRISYFCDITTLAVRAVIEP